MSRPAAPSPRTQVLTAYWRFSCFLIFNLESLEDLKRRVDCLELSNRNDCQPQIPELDDELRSAKLWLFNRSKQINNENLKWIRYFLSNWLLIHDKYNHCKVFSVYLHFHPPWQDTHYYAHLRRRNNLTPEGLCKCGTKNFEN